MTASAKCAHDRKLPGRLPRYLVISAVTVLCAGTGLGIAVHASAASSPSQPAHPVPSAIRQVQGPPSALAQANGATSVHALAADGLATTVSCGQTVIKSVTLDGDLNCSTFQGTALTITANAVTFNLNGFTVYGNPSYHAIDINGTSDILEKGSVARANIDVSIFGARDSVISTQVSDAQLDGIADVGQATKITSSTARSNTTGIESRAPGAVYRSDHEINNSDGLYATGPSLQVLSNVADGNAIVGLAVLGDGSTLTGNTADFNGADGIVVSGVSLIDGGGNTAKGNDYTAGYVPEQCNGVVCS